MNSATPFSGSLAPLDYAVLLVYLAGTMAVGLWVGRKIQTGSDFFLAGRSLPWWAIGISLVATDIGGTDMIGVGGAAYRYGMAVGNFEWIGCVPVMILAAFLFIPHFWRIGITTIPEFMERRFNVAVRTALALCWLIFMACNLGVMLLASAKLMTVLLGWSEATSIFVTAVLVGVYTCSGGLAAVVYTDVIQGIVMIGGCLLVVVIGLIDIGGIDQLQARIREIEQQHHVAAVQAGDADSEVLAAAQATFAAEDQPLEHTQLILPVDTQSPFPWPGILFGLALVLSPAYWIGNQSIVQRSLGAATEFQAKASYIWGALLKNLIPVIIVVPGLIALVKFPELQDADQALPQLIASVLPMGVRGVFVAAFLAALMSSVDSYLNAAATILTSDLYRRFVRPDANEQHLLLVGRVTTVALVVWAIWFAFRISTMETGIYAIFQTLMAFFQGPALAVLMAGLLWRRATGIAAFVGFMGGVLTAVGLFALSQTSVTDALSLEPLFQVAEPFLYFSVWAFLVSLSLVVVGSLLTHPETDAKTQYVISLRRTS